MRASWVWPAAVVVVLAVTIGANIYILIAANDPNAMVVEPDYYRKAVAWDSTLALRERSAELGWTADATLGPLTADGHSRIELTLTDHDGTPLDGARVEVTAIHNREAARRPRQVLDPVGPGRYAATFPLRHIGRWELRVVAVRDTATFTTSLRREAVRGSS